MNDKRKYRAPRGTYDILPSESYKWHWITNKFREVAAAFNYREIITPIFEIAELFERSVGSGTDIVEKEMYKFTDRKGRIFALRPEGTAPVVRSFIENHLYVDADASKLYYQGPMFRYDRPQKGRYRQFYQYGIEYIGSENPYIDAEVILFAVMFINGLGLKNYRLEINSIGCKNCSKEYDKALVSYYQKHAADLCNDCTNRMTTNPKRLLDCKIEKCRSIATKAPSILDYLDEDCKTHFSQVCKHLDNLKVEYVINPHIVRGLDYYNKTAFEIIDTTKETQNALLGGGRYDGLFETLGGQNTPAVGFAGGFERLINAIEEENLTFGNPPAPVVYVITLGKVAEIEGMLLCKEMRSKGLRVEYEIEKTSLKRQLRAAVKAGCKFAFIIGEEEVTNNTVTVKNLDDGIQETYSRLKINDIIYR